MTDFTQSISSLEPYALWGEGFSRRQLVLLSFDRPTLAYLGEVDRDSEHPDIRAQYLLDLVCACEGREALDALGPSVVSLVRMRGIAALARLSLEEIWARAEHDGAVSRGGKAPQIEPGWLLDLLRERAAGMRAL